MQDKNFFWGLAFQTIQELETEKGILASGKEEIYGCIFGRDSLITSLKLLRVYEKSQEEYFLKLVKKILLHLAELQGKNINIESGEEPGKCIHEFRPERHEHLTRQLDPSWYIYPDNIMRNYDSVDATPLFLIAVYRYWQKSHDEKFIKSLLPNIHLALAWVLNYGDVNKDGFIDYRLHPERKHGGLTTQSWMDSTESVFHESGEEVVRPVAPVEVQAYAFLALKLWSRYFRLEQKDTIWKYLGHHLEKKATDLKKEFNKKFVSFEGGKFHLAAAIDGAGKPLWSSRSSMGHVLWSALNRSSDEKTECILNRQYIPFLVKRLLEPDLFESKAGIRTLSKNSRLFSANSYHNGSIWPHDTSMIAEGLEYFGYLKEAERVRSALLEAMSHFQAPIELFVYTEDSYLEYIGENGQRACRKQAWAAASWLRELTGVK